MTKLILLILVITMSLLKATLDPSWLNKLISLVALSIVFPVLSIEMSTLLGFKLYQEYLIGVMLVNGLILMTILKDTYRQIRRMNSSKIEN